MGKAVEIPDIVASDIRFSFAISFSTKDFSTVSDSLRRRYILSDGEPVLHPAGSDENHAKTPEKHG